MIIISAFSHSTALAPKQLLVIRCIALAVLLGVPSLHPSFWQSSLPSPTCMSLFTQTQASNSSPVLSRSHRTPPTLCPETQHCLSTPCCAAGWRSSSPARPRLGRDFARLSVPGRLSRRLSGRRVRFGGCALGRRGGFGGREGRGRRCVGGCGLCSGLVGSKELRGGRSGRGGGRRGEWRGWSWLT